MAKFIVSFDIVDGNSTNYEEIFNAVKSNYPDNFSGYVRLGSLSTVYLIKSNLSMEEIRNIFVNATQKTILVIVAKYVEATGHLNKDDLDYLYNNKYW